MGLEIDSDKAYIVVHWDSKPRIPEVRILKIFYAYTSAHRYYLEELEYLRDKVEYGHEWLYLFKLPFSWVDENDWEASIGMWSTSLGAIIQTNIDKIDILASTILGEKK